MVVFVETFSCRPAIVCFRALIQHIIQLMNGVFVRHVFYVKCYQYFSKIPLKKMSRNHHHFASLKFSNSTHHTRPSGLLLLPYQLVYLLIVSAVFYLLFQSQAPEMLFTHHAGAILGVAVSPITHLAVTAGEDCQLFLFVLSYFVRSVLQELSFCFQTRLN